MIANIDPRLHHLFAPQLDALAMAPTERACGIVASLDANRGAGSAWMAGVGPDCLLTVLDLTVNEAADLTSESPGYFCVGSMSRSSLETMPVPITGEGDQALVAYRQGPGRFPYALQPGARYVSRSLCFTPAFFARTMRERVGADEALMRYLSQPVLEQLPPQLELMLNSLNPEAADRPSTAFHLAALMAETLALVLEGAEASLAAEEAAGAACSHQLVRRARHVMAASLDKPLTIASLAQELCVSRAYLAAVFKRECGRGVAEELREMRMARACELLAGTARPIAAIARTVGYARPSSFDEAFKRETGCTPAQWRRLHRW